MGIEVNTNSSTLQSLDVQHVWRAGVEVEEVMVDHYPVPPFSQPRSVNEGADVDDLVVVQGEHPEIGQI